MNLANYGLSITKRAHVQLPDPRSHFLPCDAGHLSLTLLLQIVEEALIVANAVNGIGREGLA